MLFDLRGRGRRRTVQGIYLGLAVLMGGGLVLFGIGGSVQGGLLNAVKGNGSGGGSSGFATQLKAAERRVTVAPTDAPAWAQLARLRFQVAGLGANYDQAQSAFTAQGRAQLARASQAWQRYLALNPPHPDADVASEMLQAFGGTGGLGDYPGAARAAELVAAARPSAGIYAQLAAFSYLAGETRKGDLASAKAQGLAPTAQRATLKQQLDQTKAQALAQTRGGSGASGASTGATGSAGAPTPRPRRVK